MKLEVGIYVRTKDGIIAKCTYVNKKYAFECIGYGFDRNVYKNHSGLSNYGVEEIIIKASYNIIDLIEVGDYINCKEVVEVCNHKILGKIVVLNTNCNSTIPNEKIKSVVTKKQMKSITYKVDDSNE